MTKKQKKVLWRILVSAILLVAVSLLPVEGVWKLLLYLIPYGIIGYDILRKALWGIRNREVFDENFLMAVATLGAILLGDYAEGVAVMLFYQIGELFQAVAVGKSRKNIAALMDIRPDYANVEGENGEPEQVDPEEVPVGTLILVCPGERIPLDGVIIEGTSSLNTASLTGESMPRDVGVGDEVISGCVNLSGLLKVRTTKEFGDSTVSKILDLVENSAMKKSKSENFITRFARYYTPAVCYSALALAILPMLFFLVTGRVSWGAGLWEEWSVWVTRALTFLVISCPCALVISIPLSFFGGIGGASSRGILVKGSNYLEALARTGCVVFDKTGTLTKGVFKVTKVAPADAFRTCWEDEAEERLLEFAACAECYSGHPIAAGLTEAYGRNVDRSRTGKVQEIAGRGLVTYVDDRKVAVGNERLMQELGLVCDVSDKPGTVVHIAIEEEYAGYILIDDELKEDAVAAVKALKEVGVERMVMLTGDKASVAESVAAKLGITEVRSELLPADKVAEVEKLLAAKASGEKVVFVGDGINDAPVLSGADIGIAMGALGSDAAIEAADVVLMDDNPLKIPLAMRISRKCLRIVYENIVFALAVKAICLILGAFGYADMWLAIFADVGVMVLAVLNAIRCLKVKKL